MEPEVEVKIRSLAKEDLDWDYVVQVAERHSLKALLYWQLNGIGYDVVPKEVLKSLKENFDWNVQKNLLMLGELLRIFEILKIQNLDVVPYKGPLLSMESYGNLAFREFCDLDLYLDKADVPRFKKILLSEGYEVEPDFDSKREKKYIDTQRELKFTNKKLSLTVEAHWNFQSIFLSLPAGSSLFDPKDTWINNINGVKIIRPSSEEMLLILCIHNASHRWSRLSWICDIKEHVESNHIDWAKIQEKARKLSIEKIMCINLCLARDLLGLEVPGKVLERFENLKIHDLVELLEERLWEEEYESPNLLEEVSYSFKLRNSTLYGIKDVLKGLTTPTIYEWKHLPLPTYLFPLYYLLRPIFLIKRFQL